jgi:dTDP-glucose pyrophosphorylase
VTRAVILARGLGTRMQARDGAAPLTPEQQRAADAGLKAMMPINGHAFLAYVLSAIADAGYRDVALVVAPDHAIVRRHFEASPATRVRLSYIVQPEARGTADAVLAVEPWAGTDPFVVMNADNLYPVAALRDLASLDGPGFPAFDADDLVATSNIPAARIRAFAFVELDDEGYLRSIVEKPRGGELPPEGGSYLTFTPTNRVISMNCWRFDARIFDACRDVPKSARGEYEIPEAVGLAAARGVRFKAVAARGPVLDLSRRADTADVSRRLEGNVPCP